ncbi:hypothetical protein M409DRAFT_22469 [Zasmidium cellare ATCC 36951]|uniref:Uncharacterized protein n=1 Tax=Zasmidium cellare ATCC 36951 TaxID=1080233 RepID=A0A6A6CJ17_ZASCE|nr:uncharacterized protein M409DRAFT_22469 [Zasmidium cellare ATCC 36951]KAF2167031.1 hypothetical protein M409DRAFT_22469 [Zasmidium cellare ATCC 36951]
MAVSMRRSIFAILLVLVIASAWPFASVPRTTSGVTKRDDDSPATGCGPYCAACKANTGCTPVSKRSLSNSWDFSSEYTLNNNGSTDRVLRKRVLEEVDADDIGQYLNDREDENDVIGLVERVDDSDYSVTRLEKFSDWQDTNEPLIMGTENGFLTGCTILTVVSSQAVYMGHFWQNLGFKNFNKKDPEPADFQGNVANLITGTGDLF